jgi:hypothetical protein
MEPMAVTLMDYILVEMGDTFETEVVILSPSISLYFHLNFWHMCCFMNVILVTSISE